MRLSRREGCLGQLRQAFFGLFCLTEMSNSAGQEDRIQIKGVLKPCPILAGTLQKLEEAGMSKVQTLPQPWPLPCCPSPCPVYLPTWPQFHLASAEVRATLPNPAPAAVFDLYMILHLLEP